ncbi:unnamed protein product [Phaeothamnion confervicola]
MAVSAPYPSSPRQWPVLRCRTTVPPKHERILPLLLSMASNLSHIAHVNELQSSQARVSGPTSLVRTTLLPPLRFPALVGAFPVSRWRWQIIKILLPRRGPALKSILGLVIILHLGTRFVISPSGHRITSLKDLSAVLLFLENASFNRTMTKRIVLGLLLAVHAAAAFVQRAAAPFSVVQVDSRPSSCCLAMTDSRPDHAEFGVVFEDIERSFEASSEGQRGRRAIGAAGAALLPLFVGVSQAAAKGGEYGIFEGRTASFIHPIIMGSMFVTSGYAAILGLQWRELRTAGATISALKAGLPMLSSGKQATSPVAKEAGAIAQQIREMGEDDATQVAALTADLAKLSAPEVQKLDAEIAAAATRRKELASKDVRDRHYALGSLLLGLGTFSAIEGPVNTFLRAGKLFPGPHLYAGAGITVGWAVAAALVPAMSKGNEAARLAHIVINFAVIGFFAWQVLTGLEIAVKVWEFTKWP